MYKYMEADLEVDNINGIEENHSLIQSPEEQNFSCFALLENVSSLSSIG